VSYAGSEIDHWEFDRTIAELRRFGDGRLRRRAFYRHLALSPLCVPVEAVSDSPRDEARAYTSRGAYERGPDADQSMLEMPAKDLLLHLAQIGCDLLCVAAAPPPSGPGWGAPERLHWAYVPQADILSLAEGVLPDAASAWQVPLDLLEECQRAALRLPGLGAISLTRLGGNAMRELRLTAFFHPDFRFQPEGDALEALALYVGNVVDGVRQVTLVQAPVAYFYEDGDAFRRILYCNADYLTL